MINFSKLAKVGTATNERLVLLGTLSLLMSGQSCMNGWVGDTEYKTDFFDPPKNEDEWWNSLSSPGEGPGEEPTCDRIDGVACEGP